MGLDEAILLAFIPIGTLLLNIWRKNLIGCRSWAHATYLIVSLVMAILPLIYIRSIEPNQTALGVILAGVAFFWFAIVGARNANT
jgi:hypothetical protein